MKKIEHARIALELTVEGLADLLGVSAGTVNNWSSANKLPLWAIKSIDAHIEIKELKLFRNKFRDLVLMADD